MNASPAKRLLAHGWLYAPAVACPISGGVIKLANGSTWAAVIVGGAPYAIYLVPSFAFVVGYLAAVIRYLCSDSDEEGDGTSDDVSPTLSYQS